MNRTRKAHPSLAYATALALVGSLLASAAHAQVWGDADGSGAITVTDGVNVLRAAAGLSSACPISVCDVDGSGAVTVTDGVNVLRTAAGLQPGLTGFVLRWGTLPDVAGYVVHWGPASRAYTDALDIGVPQSNDDGVTTFFLEEAGTSDTIYFAVTSYDEEGRMSTFSNELTAVIP